ncbi:hypothetical protein BKA70DRAFT_1102088, partial [Coprinopsis sp. MPI-PUGE-AT-0042]
VFGPSDIFASFNDMLTHFIDLPSHGEFPAFLGETWLSNMTIPDGMKFNANLSESSPSLAMLATQDGAVRCHEAGV